MTPEERFKSRIRVNPDSGCWEWTGALDRDGYGRIKVEGKALSTHRYSYALVNGEIPPKTLIDHKCHNRKCANPEHLRPTTAQENTMNRKGAIDGSKSGHRNVSWHSGDEMWQVQVQKDGKMHFIGKYNDLGLAKRSAEAARKRMFGDYAGGG